MNNTLDTPNIIDNESNFELDFNNIMNLCKKKYDYQELIALLFSDKIAEKQLAVIELSEIKSKNDAFLLTSNLVGQDGKIREVVAFKINELTKNPKYVDFFIADIFFEIFLQGIMDINGNVCRQIIDLINNINEFKNYLCEKLPESITKILDEIKKLDHNAKQYKISKRNFQLYWSLEALYYIIDIIDIEKIQNVIFVTGDFDDYTIREKTAKILAKLNSEHFNELKNKLKNDKNYYVRRYMHG